MMPWQTLLGALTGAALTLVGVLAAPRWMKKSPARWEQGVAVLLGGVSAGLLATAHPLDSYFWQQVLLLAILITASLVDLHDRIIPNDLVLFGLASGVVLSLILPYPDKTVMSALLGAVIGFLALLLPGLLVRGGMGMGDVKLAAVIGLFLGHRWVGMALVLSVMAGGLVGGLLMLFRVLGRKDHIPFGPFLALGTVLAILYGVEIWAWYRGG